MNRQQRRQRAKNAGEIKEWGKEPTHLATSVPINFGIKQFKRENKYKNHKLNSDYKKENWSTWFKVLGN